MGNQPNVSSHEWACFVGLETSIQSFTIAYTLLVYTVGCTWIRLGYNSKAMWHLSTIRSDAFTQLMIQLGVQPGTEFANMCLMEIWFRRRLGPSGAVGRLSLLLRDTTFMWYFCLCTLLQSTNIWPGYIEWKFCN